jgi:hypothetical protein
LLVEGASVEKHSDLAVSVPVASDGPHAGETRASHERSRCMHASVRRYRATDAEALVKQVQEEFVERLKTIEGFVGYYVIDGGDGTLTSITFGETQEAVEASSARAKEWVVERAAHLVESAPDLTTGEVRVRAER